MWKYLENCTTAKFFNSDILDESNSKKEHNKLPLMLVV